MRAAQIFQTKIGRVFPRSFGTPGISLDHYSIRSDLKEGVIKIDDKNFYFEATTSPEIVNKLCALEQTGRLLLMANSLERNFEQLALINSNNAYTSDDDDATLLNSFERVQVIIIEGEPAKESVNWKKPRRHLMHPRNAEEEIEYHFYFIVKVIIHS